MKNQLRNILTWVIKVALGATLLVLLVDVVGGRLLLERLTNVQWSWLLAMYVMLWVEQIVAAYQLRYILQKTGLRIHTRRVFLASQLASLYSLVVPGEVAASAAKWADLSAATGRKSHVLNAMLYNRLILTGVPLVIGTFALAADNPFKSLLIVGLAASMLLGTLATGFALYHPRFGPIFDRLLRYVLRFLGARLSAKGSVVLDSIASVREWPVRNHLASIGFVALTNVVSIATFTAAMAAVHIDANILSILWVFAFITLVNILPFTIGGIGVREALLVIALAPLGVPAEQAVALGLILFTNILLMAAVGFVYQMSILSGVISGPPSSRNKHSQARSG